MEWGGTLTYTHPIPLEISGKNLVGKIIHLTFVLMKQGGKLYQGDIIMKAGDSDHLVEAYVRQIDEEGNIHVSDMRTNETYIWQGPYYKVCSIIGEYDNDTEVDDHNV